jgi:4-amino-4-deoxy-L-arabinose transferase-like glycosyltransferase
MDRRGPAHPLAASPAPGAPARPEAGAVRAGALRAALFAAAAILPFAFVHVDDVDGAVYQVVARHVAQGRGLLDLSFLPDYWPRFFEHPPLFFWVQAAVARACSEAALPWLGAACGIGTVLATFAAGRALVGARAALLGAFVLASTEGFFRYQARPRLDPPLALAYTGSVALLLAARGRPRWLLAGGLAAGLGALVKGPPALGAPLSAALALLVLGRAGELRRARALPAALGAALPPLAFLLLDAARGGAWWHGYVRGQVLASMTGARFEGAADHLYLVKSIAGAFWPGLPFLVLAVALALRAPRAPASRAALALVAWAAVVVGGFSLAGRAYWWYAVPAYPPLALAAGAGLEAVLRRLLGGGGARRALAGMTALATVALALAPLWPERWLVRPCPLGDLPARAAALAPAGSDLVLAASPARGFTDARAHAGWLAQHSGRDVVLAPGPRAGVGLFEEPAPGVPAGWTPAGRHGTWVLATRGGD